MSLMCSRTHSLRAAMVNDTEAAVPTSATLLATGPGAWFNTLAASATARDSPGSGFIATDPTSRGKASHHHRLQWFTHRPRPTTITPLNRAVLEDGEKRRRDEDGRVGPGHHADEQRDGELAEGGCPEETGPNQEERETTGTTEERLVLIDRIITWFIEMFTTSAKGARCAARRASFSRMRSKTTIVS